MTMTTKKLYYEDVYLSQATATVVSLEADAVVLDETCFYPEGGGQVGDTGWIGPLRVRDTQKRGGVQVNQPGLPSVAVQGEVVHYVESDPREQLAVGDRVEIRIDEDRRRGCMDTHGATHLLLAALTERFGEEDIYTKGCLITPEYARLDVATSQRFSGSVREELQQRVNDWMSSGAPVAMEPVEGVPEMFIWQARNVSPHLSMPCGGTHHAELNSIGGIRLKRRREGSNLERIYLYSTKEEERK